VRFDLIQNRNKANLSNRDRDHVVPAMKTELSHAPLAALLSSPLRLELLGRLMAGPGAIEELVLATGRHERDVRACLEPLVACGVIASTAGRYKLAPRPSGEVQRMLESAIAASRPVLAQLRMQRQALDGFVGIDPRMHVVRELIDTAARLDVPALVVGEPGVGKKIVARAIHDASHRRTCFFGAVRAGSSPDAVLDVHLFGRVGGPNGNEHVGLVERCQGGTLLIENVDDLSPGTQLRLGRLLNDGSFARIGENPNEAPRQADVHIVATSTSGLWEQTANGTFHEELASRVRTLVVRVPSLRDRISDLPYLCAALLAKNAGGTGRRTITPAAQTRLARYNWPGNITELEQVLGRAAMMAGDAAPIDVEHLSEVELLSDPAPRRSSRPSDQPEGTLRPTGVRTLSDVEREHITTVFRACRGNIRSAADALGLSRTTLYRKLREYNLEATL
jgi:DNA-binding NtrC family response regulator